MRCEQISAYLPGYAGGDLRTDTNKAVAQHLAGCAFCRSETDRLERVTSGLRAMAHRPLDPPPMLLEAVLDGVGDRKRRLIPPIVPPNVAPDLVRVFQENREAITQVGATALVAAGTAFALWKAVRSRRAASEIATG